LTGIRKNQNRIKRYYKRGIRSGVNEKK
jgi:hypothetical protein